MASKYTKLVKRFWADADVRQLGDEEKLAAIYIMNRQANRIGLFAFSTGMAAEDLGWEIGRFVAVLQAVCRGLGWSYDPTARVLYIPSWWRTNAPENDSHFKGCLSDIEEVPSSHLTDAFLANETHLTDRQKAILRDLSKRTLDTSSTRPPPPVGEVSRGSSGHQADILAVTELELNRAIAGGARVRAHDAAADPVADLSPDLAEAAALCRDHPYLGGMLDPAVTLAELRAGYPDLDLVMTLRRARAALTPERIEHQRKKRGSPSRFLVSFFEIAARDLRKAVTGTPDAIPPDGKTDFQRAEEAEARERRWREQDLAEMQAEAGKGAS